jgi:hypothetical protein
MVLPFFFVVLYDAEAVDPNIWYLQLSTCYDGLFKGLGQLRQRYTALPLSQTIHLSFHGRQAAPTVAECSVSSLMSYSVYESRFLA